MAAARNTSIRLSSIVAPFRFASIILVMNDESDKDHLKFAACLAGVFAYMAAKDSEQQSNQETSGQPDSGYSNWGRASLLEQHCRATVVSIGDLAVLRILPVLLALLIQATPAAASGKPDSRDAYRSAENSFMVSGESAPGAAPEESASMAVDPEQSGYGVAPAGSRTIRVLLLNQRPSVEITFPDGAELLEEPGGRLLAQLPPRSSWRIGIDPRRTELVFSGVIGNFAAPRVLLSEAPSGYRTAGFSRDTGRCESGFGRQPYVLETQAPKFTVALSARKEFTPKGPYRPIGFETAAASCAPGLNTVVLKPLKADGIFALAGKGYRGSVRIKPDFTQSGLAFSVINLIELEDYLLSVVPSEMPPVWHPEALKAQTIAARSYAAANLGKHEKEGYDVKATVEDQVYLGVQTERESSNWSVAQTHGLVLKHQGKVVSAFFHSSSGGSTETSEHVWSKPIAYLNRVSDFDDDSPHFSWQKSLNVDLMESALAKAGKPVGCLLAILPVSRGPSKRVKSLLVCGSDRTLVVSGEELRRIFTLPSTLFNLGFSDGAYHLAGRGNGHGLGLSQWGAKFLADRGYNASQILSHYYKDVSIEAL